MQLETDPYRRIAASFAKQAMMETFAAELERVEVGRVVISAPILPLARQQQGLAHAALTFGLGDTAAGYAALSATEAGHEVLTAEMKINLLAPGRGTRIRATGEVLKPGRRLIVVSARVEAIAEDNTATLIAVLQGTIVPVRV